MFEAFAKAYIDKFKFGTTTTGDFRDLFIQFISTLPTKPDTATIKSSHASPDRSAILGAGKVATPKNSTAPSSKKDGATPVISASAHKLVQAIDWDKLFLSPGLPELVPDFSNSLSAVALSLAKKWIQYSESVVKVGTPSKTKIPDKPKTGAMNVRSEFLISTQ